MLPRRPEDHGRESSLLGRIRPGEDTGLAAAGCSIPSAGQTGSSPAAAGPEAALDSSLADLLGPLAADTAVVDMAVGMLVGTVVVVVAAGTAAGSARREMGHRRTRAWEGAEAGYRHMVVVRRFCRTCWLDADTRRDSGVCRRRQRFRHVDGQRKNWRQSVNEGDKGSRGGGAAG